MSLSTALDGAMMVRHDPSSQLTLAWFGGHAIHAFDQTGRERSVWTIDEFQWPDDPIDEVRLNMREHIRTQNYP